MDRFLQKVAGGAGVFRDHGPLASQKGVHEAGLARVDRTGERHGHAFAPAARPLETRQQGGNRRSDVRDGVQKAFLRQAFHFFLGEVHGEANLGAQMFQPFPEVRDALPEHAVQLGGGEACAFSGRSRDHFRHGFGLRQVHSAVEEGPAGEFPAFGQPSAAGKARLQHRGQQDRPAVALEFRHVFAGKGLGTGHVDRQRVVEHVAFRIQNAPAPQGPRPESVSLSGGPEQVFQNGQRRRAADPDDAHAARSGGRRYRRYRIGAHRGS